MDHGGLVSALQFYPPYCHDADAPGCSRSFAYIIPWWWLRARVVSLTNWKLWFVNKIFLHLEHTLSKSWLWFLKVREALRTFDSRVGASKKFTFQPYYMLLVQIILTPLTTLKLPFEILLNSGIMGSYWPLIISICSWCTLQEAAQQSVSLRVGPESYFWSLKSPFPAHQ